MPKQVRAWRGAVASWRVALSLVIGAASGCGPASDRPEPVYVPPVEARQTILREWRGDTVGGSRPMRFVGQRQVLGQTWQRLQMGHFDRQAPDGEEWWVTFAPDRVEFAGGEIFYPSSTLPAGTPNITATVSEPVVIPLDLPVGAPQIVRVAGSVLIGDPAAGATTVAVDEEVEVTLVAESEVVETFAGDVTSARHYHATAAPLDQPGSADVWWVDGVGVVRAEYEWAGLPGGNGLAIESVIAALAAENGYQNLMKEALLDEATPNFDVSTYDLAGTFDADKQTHAKMVLELRWADIERARTTDPVPVSPDFGTVWGTFPSSLVASQVSLFHPEEAGQGLTYWVAVVDQAAKNETSNPIAYHVGAHWDPIYAPSLPSGPVRADALVLYKRVETGGL